MKWLFFSGLLLTFSNFAFAYDLSGNASNDGNGSYSVNLENENGHQYSGEATDNGDGTMDVTVEDYNGQTYSGTATDNSNSTYSLDLQNETSGGTASGTLTIDN